MAVETVGMDVRVNVGDSMSNSGQIFDSLPVTLVLRAFVQYLIAFYCRPDIASGVIACRFVGLTVPP